jgi:hypothetical protein
VPRRLQIFAFCRHTSLLCLFPSFFPHLHLLVLRGGLRCSGNVLETVDFLVLMLASERLRPPRSRVLKVSWESSADAHANSSNVRKLVISTESDGSAKSACMPTSLTF